MLRKIFHQWLSSYQGLGTDIWLLSFVNFINRLGSMVVIFMTLYLTSQRGFTVEEVGYILMFNGFGAVVGTFLGGWLTDKFGYYKLQIIAMHIQGFILMLLPRMEGAVAISVTIFFMALVAETIRPANQVAFIAHSNPEIRTRAISLNRMGINLSFTAAPALGGLLVLWSWEAIFWVDAITCIAAAWLMIFYLSEKPAEKHQPSLDDTSPNTLASAYTDWPFVKFVGLTLINAIVFMQIIWTIPLFFQKAYGWDESFIGLVLAANGFFVAVVEMPLIMRIEKRYPVLSLVRTGLLCYIFAHLALAIGLPPMVAAIIYIIIISFGEIYVMPFSFSYASKMAGPSKQGQYMAFYSVSYALSQIFAPLIGTQMIHHFGYNQLWYLMAAMAAVSFLGMSALGDSK